MAFDYAKFKELNELLKKAQFVPMDPSMAAPPAGGPPPEGGGDPGAAPPPGGDPGAAPPPPMDPAMMGGGAMPPPPPMDPAMMGGGAMPPPPGDPGAGGSMVSMPTDEFLKFLKQIIGLIDKHNDAVGPQPQQQAAPNPALPAGSSDPQLSEINAKLDALLR